jgi:hypothetical protein
MSQIKVKSLGFRDYNLGSRVRGLNYDLGRRVKGLRIWTLGLRVQG